MSEANKSDFRFDKYIIKHSELDVRGNELNGDSLSIHIKPKGIKSKNRFTLSLDILIQDDKQKFHVNVVVDGYFTFREDINLEEHGHYFVINAPAILFPYIRGYISMITSLSGIGNILLPTLNLEGLAEELSKNIEEKK